MYYTKNLILPKLQMTDKIYLYKDGDECTAVTGGWVITGGSIIKNATNIQLNHAVAGSRSIKTVNNIEVTKYDRVFVRMMTTGNASNYAFNFFKNSNTTRFNTNKGAGGTNAIAQNFFTPNVEEVVMFWTTVDSLQTIGAVNNFGTWYIYEIWIEKYNN